MKKQLLYAFQSAVDAVRKTRRIAIGARAAAIAWVKKSILGMRGSPTPGSDGRRASMRVCLWLSLAYFAFSFIRPAAIGEAPSWVQLAGVGAVLCFSVWLFFLIVLLMPFRDNNNDWKLDAPRLAWDTMVSAAFMICAFSLLYWYIGVTANSEDYRPSRPDALYFSMVTFSTLGYGDFAPQASYRIVAAFQALLGNLHLGVIVAATFAAIRR